MIRAHAMPFGAEVTADGVRFHLWAPARERVTLRVDDTEHAMESQGEGWYALALPGVGAGSRYGFVMDDGLVVPDPASRFQPEGVHGLSEVVDPAAHTWADAHWFNRPWHETVLYEAHVGAFTGAGTYAGMEKRLDHLAELGVTALELMPLSCFPGSRNWGYDGVLPFAPATPYGRPSELKQLIEAAHARGLMVFLDVVYNHFGPEGNYLHLYAPQFFTDRYDTPWGAAIDFSRRPVREFFIHNALYWLQEYHVDGLRFDAVHAIFDDSQIHFLDELRERVRATVPRPVHLVLENDANQTGFLARGYEAQWNDDAHHGYHVLATGEAGGYYRDYSDRPRDFLGRTLAEGFAYQGEPSPHRHGEPRGEPSAHLPPTCFVDFIQNHDQVGNRALGDRLTETVSGEAIRALHAILLLSPHPPLLFMGEEFMAASPFQFFCDFGPELADAVREGRRDEFRAFPQFRETEIPDPNAESTFERSKLDWNQATDSDYLPVLGQLLKVRSAEIVPRLQDAPGAAAHWEACGDTALAVRWTLGDSAKLTLRANPHQGAGPPAQARKGRLLWSTHPPVKTGEALPPWYVDWSLEEPHGR